MQSWSGSSKEPTNIFSTPSTLRLNTVLKPLAKENTSSSRSPLKVINRSPTTQAKLVEGCVSNPAWKEHNNSVSNPAWKEHITSEINPMRIDYQKVHKSVTYDLALDATSHIDTPCIKHPVPVDYPNPDPQQDPDPDPDPPPDLTIPDLSNVLITHKVVINGIQATTLIDSGALEDFVDTHFVLAYNMPTTSATSVWLMELDKTPVPPSQMQPWS
jgi:hypothetical protein